MTPSPLGEGWEGGMVIGNEIILEKHLFRKKCYIDSEEIHNYRLGEVHVLAKYIQLHNSLIDIDILLG